MEKEYFTEEKMAEFRKLSKEMEERSRKIPKAGVKRTAVDTKAQQIDNNIDRTFAFRKWRRNIPDPVPYTTDVDMIEWVYVDDEPKAVAVLELTRIDYNIKYPKVKPSYLAAIKERYEKGQKKLACKVAQALNCCAYIVAYREDLTQFYVCNLTRDKGWRVMSEEGYGQWLSDLRQWGVSY
jgi:hypothetical protein